MHFKTSSVVLLMASSLAATAWATSNKSARTENHSSASSSNAASSHFIHSNVAQVLGGLSTSLPSETEKNIMDMLPPGESGRGAFLTASKTTKQSLGAMGYTTLSHFGSPHQVYDHLKLCTLLRAQPQRGAEIKELYVSLRVYEDCAFTRETLPHLETLFIKEIVNSPFDIKWDPDLISIWEDVYSKFKDVKTLQFFSQSGRTPLHLLASHDLVLRRQERLRLLLDSKKVDVNAIESMTGSTALHEAVFNNHEEMVKELIQSGANVNYADSSGETPLQTAARSGHDHLIPLLLKHGAILKATDAEGKTALHKAILNRQTECAIALIDADVKKETLSMADQDGKTPVQIARELHFREIVEHLG